MRIFLFLLPLCSLWTLEKHPWFGDVYEFHLHTGYAFDWFRSVNGSVKPLHSTSYDHILFSNLEFSLCPQWSVEIEGKLSQTPRQSFGVQSLALQARYLVYDDIIGDPFSMAIGGNLRYVFPDAVRDISCPYGANIDFQGNISIGKEFDSRGDWRFRLWAYGSLGLANEGSPWVRAIAAFETNCLNIHKWAWFFEINRGYGEDTSIDINNFHGYAQIRYHYIDIAMRYGYGMGSWGTFRMEYKRRIVAVRCPEKVDTIVLSFLIPFCF